MRAPRREARAGTPPEQRAASPTLPAKQLATAVASVMATASPHQKADKVLRPISPATACADRRDPGTWIVRQARFLRGPWSRIRDRRRKGPRYEAERKILPALDSDYEVVQLTTSSALENKMYLDVKPYAPSLEGTSTKVDTGKMCKHRSSSTTKSLHPHAAFINDTDLIFNSEADGNVYLLRQK
jgi:hypothetical protein